MADARVVICKNCGKAILLCASIRAAIDHHEDFDELVDVGHEQKDMPLEQAKKLGICDCLFEEQP